MSSYSFYDFRQATRKLQNALSGYSNLENSIRESTNTDTWGPTTQQKKQILNWILSYSNSSTSSDFYDSNIDTSVIADEDNEIGRYTIEFIFKRISEYSGSEKKGIYNILKKQLVTRGYECIVIYKCLILVEYLLINCYRLQKKSKKEEGKTVEFEFEFELTNEVRKYSEILESLMAYKVINSFDGMDISNEFRIQQLAKKLISLINDDEMLLSERTKLNPSEFQSNGEDIEGQDDGEDKEIKRSNKKLFYDEDELDLTSLSNSSNKNESVFQLKKDKDPFGRGRISSISKNVNNLLSKPSSSSLASSASHRKFNSQGSIKLNGDSHDENDLLKYNKSDLLHDSIVQYNDFKSVERYEETDDYDDDDDGYFYDGELNAKKRNSSGGSSRRYKDSAIGGSSNIDKYHDFIDDEENKVKTPIAEDNEEGEFGDFQTSSSYSVSKKSNNETVPIMEFSKMSVSSRDAKIIKNDGKKNDVFDDLLIDFRT